MRAVFVGGLPLVATLPSRPSVAGHVMETPSARQQQHTRVQQQRVQLRRRTVAVAAGGSSGGVALQGDAFEALRGCEVYVASTGEKVDITNLWGDSDRVMLAFGRSMG